MSTTACPHCQKLVYSWRDRYLAGKWKILRCPECGGHACAQPLVMALFYMLYVWDVMLFGYLAYADQNWIYLAVMAVIWLILDWFSLYIPLGAMKRGGGGS